MSDPSKLVAISQHAEFGALGPVRRAALATRGNTKLDPKDVVEAVDRGINCLNWCGYSDGLSAAVRSLKKRRREIIVAVQFHARSAKDAAKELEEYLKELDTDFVDVVTYYYVEHVDEWQEILAPGGAHEYLESAKANGRVRSIGVTSHQRTLAAEMARSGKLDMLMIRYNAAHRGAEEDVFPTTTKLQLPVVTYTGLRWGGLLIPTPDDPPGFQLPSALECYQFVLAQPAVTAGIMAPNGRAELEEDLQLLDESLRLTYDRYREIASHGDRVRKHGGRFP